MQRPAGPSKIWLLSSVVLLLAGCEGSDRPSKDQIAVVQSGLLAAFQTRDTADVIVSFRDPRPGSLAGANLDLHREALRLRADRIERGHASGFVVSRRFNHLPALAGLLSRPALDALARDPDVSYIQLDSGGGGALRVAVPAIGGDQATAMFGVTGKGVRVAVLDTGVSTQHPDLQSSIVATQHCFTHSACPPSNSNEGTSAEDDHGHGSNVAGIITSDGVLAGVGFAPGAEIVAVKIDDRNDRGYQSDWAAGLDWVFQNLSTLKVRIVNMSICTDVLYSTTAQCDAGESVLALAVKNLVDAGVTVFASSGNQGSATQTSAPACNTGSIAVGATYKSAQGREPPAASGNTFRDAFGTSFGACTDATTAFDQVACFSNSGSRVDVVAPGAIITSDYVGTQTSNFTGTSQASPAAAGVAALMLECNPTLTPAQIKNILQTSGVQVTDAKNGQSYASIRALAAVRAACGADGGMPPSDGGSDGQGTGGRGGSGGGGAGTGGGGSTGSGGSAGTGNGGGGATGGGGAGGGGTGGGATGGGAGGRGGTTGTAGSTAGAGGNGGGCSCSTSRTSPPYSGGTAFACGAAFLLAGRPRSRPRPRSRDIA
jgi:subtilisin family serine protease